MITYFVRIMDKKYSLVATSRVLVCSLFDVDSVSQDAWCEIYFLSPEVALKVMKFSLKVVVCVQNTFLRLM